MKKFLFSRRFLIGIAVLVIIIVVSLLAGVGKPAPKALVTAVVENGSVRQLISVSGVSEATQNAELSFPTTGIVKKVNVKVGDRVQTGDILLQLDATALTADRQDALAFLTSAEADRTQLNTGPQSENRALTDENLILKETALVATRANEERKIESASRALLSSSVTAYSDDAGEEAAAPLISGSYICNKEGTYTLNVYASNAASGYSYRLSGLESGTYEVSTEQTIALGTCGLEIIFSPNTTYNKTTWYIDIPNTKSTAYSGTKSAYDAAVTQAASAIALAEQELTVAKATKLNNNAPARNELLIKADAAVTQAEARLARVGSQIEDRIIRATFPGIITEITIKEGELATNVPVITLLSSGEFQVTARIPEIDVEKLVMGQSVEMIFDAKSDEKTFGTVTFISLKETLIDGVAYYEAFITPTKTSPWMRSGLNADVDIIFSEVNDVLRVPNRFLISDGNNFSVLKKTGELIATTTVSVTLEGNDGFVALTGLSAGDTVVAP